MGTALITVFVVCVIIYFAAKINIFLGIAALLVGISFTIYTNRPAYLRARANAEFTKGNEKKSLALYEKAYASKNRKYSVDISYANALLRMRNPNAALEIVNSLLAHKIIKELKCSAKQIRILANYKLGNLDEAYNETEELFEDGFINSNMYCLKGFLMLLMDKPIDETYAFCEKAFDYDDDNRDNVDNMVLCYYKKGDYKNAYELGLKMVEKFPKFVEARYHTALACVKLGKIDEAKQQMSEIDDCKRTYMTTVSIEEVDELKKSLNP